MKQRKNILLIGLLMMTLFICAFPAHAKAKRELTMTVDSVQTDVEKYNPYYGSKLKIYTTISAQKVKKNDMFSLQVRVRNSDGKTVFKKTKKITGAAILAKGENVRFSVKWKGRASAGNGAKLKANSVVPAGDYTVTATLKCTRARNALKPAKASGTASFKVDKTVYSYDPVTGKVIPRYTGYAEIDYMAEEMLKEAGVKLDMPEDLRVRLIYNYMTVNFKHIVDISNVKPYYNLNALAPDIAAFKKETKKKYNEGKITYSNKWSGEINHMAKRAGRCNNNAAAFCILCNHAGISCKRIVGKVFSGKTQMNHFWNSAVVDGVRWYYDIDVEIHHYNGSGVSAFSQYKKTLAQSKKNHIYG